METYALQWGSVKRTGHDSHRNGVQKSMRSVFPPKRQYTRSSLMIVLDARFYWLIHPCDFSVFTDFDRRIARAVASTESSTAGGVPVMCTTPGEGGADGKGGDVGGKQSGRAEIAPDSIREQSGSFGLCPQDASVPQRVNDRGDDGRMWHRSCCLHRLQRCHGLAPLPTLSAKPPTVIGSKQAEAPTLARPTGCLATLQYVHNYTQSKCCPIWLTGQYVGIVWASSCWSLIFLCS